MNLPTSPRGFETTEFEARTAKSQFLMEQRGLIAMLLTTEAEIRYYSGFHTPFWQSPTRPWFLIVPLSGKPIAVIPEIGAACMDATWIHDIRTWPAPQPGNDGISLLVDTLNEGSGETRQDRHADGAGNSHPHACIRFRQATNANGPRTVR